MADQEKESEQYFTQDHVKQELINLYQDFKNSAIEFANIRHIEFLSYMSFALYMADFNKEAHDLLLMMGDKYYQGPWVYCDVDTLEQTIKVVK